MKSAIFAKTVFANAAVTIGVALLSGCPAPCTTNEDCGTEGICATNGECFTPVGDGGPSDGGPSDGGPGDVTILEFTSSASTAVAGTQVRLSWEVVNAEECTLNGVVAFPEREAMVTPGVVDADDDANVTYTLECSGENGPVAAAVVVGLVNAALAVDDDTINAGTSVNLTRSEIGAESCVLSSDARASIDTDVVTPLQDTLYTYSCVRDGVTARAQVQVMVASVSLLGPSHAVADQSVSLTLAGAHVEDCTVGTFGGVAVASTLGAVNYAVVGGTQRGVARCTWYDGVTLEATHDILGVGFETPPSDTPAQMPVTWTTFNDDTLCMVTLGGISQDVSQNGAEHAIAAPIPGVYALTCSLGDVTISDTFTVYAPATIESLALHVVQTPSGNVELSVNTTAANNCEVSIDEGAPLQFAPQDAFEVVGLTDGPHTLSVICTNDFSASQTSTAALWWGNADDDDLTALANANATIVTGQMNLNDNTTATAFVGAQAVVEVGGNFTIQGNDVLAAINLERLERVGGSFSVQSNQELGSIRLDSLSDIGGSLSFNGNANLVSVNIPQLNVVEGTASISSNAILTSFTTESLISVGGDIQFAGNSALQSILMDSLQQCGGNFTLVANVAIPRVTMQALTLVGGVFTVASNLMLAEVSLGALSQVDGNLAISNNGNLNTLLMTAMVRIEGNLAIENNGISDIGFDSLDFVGGSFVIRNNNNLACSIPELLVTQLQTLPNTISISPNQGVCL